MDGKYELESDDDDSVHSDLNTRVYLHKDEGEDEDRVVATRPTAECWEHQDFRRFHHRGVWAFVAHSRCDLTKRAPLLL